MADSRSCHMRMSVSESPPETHDTSQKHVLIVHAHPRSESYNETFLRTAVDTLTACGHTVEVSDLYQMGFDPKIRLEDFEGKISEGIKREVDKLNRADLVVFQFPMYWCSVPAILKGWMDRVLQCVTSFVQGENRLYGRGYMKGKKAILSFTTEQKQAPEVYDVFLLPIQNGMLYFVGFGVLSPHIVHLLDYKTEDDRKKALSDWSARLSAIFDEPVLEMITVDDWVVRKRIS